jgi:uncharacterized protein (DUF934 family)
MPKLIKRNAVGGFAYAEDAFVNVGEDDGAPAPIPGNGGVILSLARFQVEGDALLSAGRQVGVRVASSEAVEDLAYDLPRLALVALEFPKFRDGRAFTSARLLRERFGYTGEIRAVGDVFREQAGFMVRCGFDAYEPSDGARPEQWAAAAGRYRHVYQRAADARAPAYEERG